jgi:hypothetical protein
LNTELVLDLQEKYTPFIPPQLFYKKALLPILQYYIHIAHYIHIHCSHAMTCLMAYHNKKRAEAISIMLQVRRNANAEKRKMLTNKHIFQL